MTNALLVVFGPILEPFLLVFAPAWSWERTFRAQRGLLFMLILFLLPLLVLSSLGETYRLVCYGMLQGELAHRKAFLLGEAVVFETAQLLLSLLAVFAGAA